MAQPGAPTATAGPDGAQVRVTAWNVRGAIQRLFESQEAVRALSGTDVVGFTEMGGSAKQQPAIIPGFRCVVWAPRPRVSHAGGVACYDRTALASWVREVKSVREDGICIVSISPPGRRPLQVCFCYTPHPDSRLWLPGRGRNLSPTQRTEKKRAAVVHGPR